jgi:hypothetical protein
MPVVMSAHEAKDFFVTFVPVKHLSQPGCHLAVIDVNQDIVQNQRIPIRVAATKAVFGMHSGDIEVAIGVHSLHHSALSILVGTIALDDTPGNDLSLWQRRISGTHRQSIHR